MFIRILCLFTTLALLAIPSAAETKKHIAFTDYLNGQYGIQHMSGPGTYEFDNGGSLPLVVTNTTVLTRTLHIKNLPIGEHLLLQHIKDYRFELIHEATGQKATLRLPLKK
jgi:hypothetical protein